MKMQIGKNRCLSRLLVTVLGLLLLVGLFSLVVPGIVLAEPSDSLEITGDGVTNPITLTLADLQAMDQHQQVYSVINTWPTKKWYVGKGVKLMDLLKLAGMKEDAKLLKFSSNDGYSVALTVKELLEDTRYCFPHFKDNSTGDGDGNIPGSAAKAKRVEPIVALISVEGSNNPDYMSDLNSLLLMMGQRAVTEQTGNLFVKYLNKIEVSTVEPPKWDNPQANPDSGVVPPGTMVVLSNANMDDDKIYYTTDGSTPTVNSTMYNWIASRWWSARADVLGMYNTPIGPINEDTIIKAITIGPGKRDSDVVTFSYKVSSTPDSTTETGTDATEPETDIDEVPDESVEKPVESGQAINLADIRNHWAQKNIEELVALGAVSGCPDGTFKPDNTVTRAEFVTMLVKAFKLKNQGGEFFADTAAHWARDYIAAAVADGLASGYDADTFGPDNLITREQMAVMIANAAKLDPVADETQFADSSSISEWARGAVAAAVKNGIIKGRPDNTVCPQDSATRAEAVTVIVNALHL